ncbi:hypothetical protein GCM10007907_33660 [Chitinimonas prasina]|uniref:DUF8198 domain-containing protein n=1 Tax=Chitinimonas prasina TaxID=1434937 RepID=A0ABQ5YIZ3_9NEIS|nr:hypothetical protein [Chitinimonas prasina]GLR14576.1 hypothetical protein GCM10007907_33660 [Chitinimonas prasina]
MLATPDEEIVQSGLSRPRYLLARWQADRLAVTYADLRESERYAQATAFFLSDLYGPKDFSKRDQDGERIVGKMRALLPARAMAAIQSALHLNRLSHELDAAMAVQLFDEMGLQAIDAASYAEAYRRCGLEARREQIDLVDNLGHELDAVVQKPLVQLALKLAHGPAHMAGLGELQDFLERGVAAFLHMKGADEFLATIRERETRILERIAAREQDPFR